MHGDLVGGYAENGCQLSAGVARIGHPLNCGAAHGFARSAKP